jgi:Sodium:dicarboxylate symporter family
MISLFTLVFLAALLSFILISSYFIIRMNMNLRAIWKRIINLHLTVWIFISMALGVLVGALAPKFSEEYLSLLSSSIFLPMIKACIVPLVFSTLVVGIGKLMLIKLVTVTI